MSYPEAINYLYGLQKYGIKLGLEKTGIILSRLSNPHKDFLSIHVAGTNGKGSISAMTASVLMAHGFNVGLFTSPHLVSFTERIRINNEQISESDVVSLTEEIRAKISELKSQIPEPTFFEFVTAMAFLYFSRNNVDWAVIETGMGGRLDATNIITPEVSVITKISYDHKEFLGETLTDIAYEKAGIIKKAIPVVSAHQDKEVGEVIAAVAKERSSPLFIYGKDFSGELKSSDIEGITFDYFDDSCTITDLHTPLAGEHQLSNACIAIKVATIALKDRYASCVMCNEFKDSSRIREGLANTEWRGRLEIVNNNPAIMIDGAHNPDAAKALSEFIKKHLNDYRIILIMGIMADKDIYGIMSPLLPVASEIIFAAPDYGRAASPQKLAEAALQMGFSSKIASSVSDAIEMAKKCCESEIKNNHFTHPLILITGSFYTIGEALEMLGKKAVLGTLRETI